MNVSFEKAKISTVDWLTPPDLVKKYQDYLDFEIISNCFMENKDFLNSDILKLCNDYNMTTIKSDVIKDNVYKTIKDKLYNGVIFAFDSNNVDEIKVSINYILSKTLNSYKPFR